MTKPIGFENWLSHNFIFDSTGRDFTMIGSFVINDGAFYKLFRGPTIASASSDGACVITTTEPHGFHTGQAVWHKGFPSPLSTLLNGEHTITVLSTTSYSVPVDTSTEAAIGNVGAITGIDSDFRCPASLCAYIPGKNCTAAHGDPWDRAWIG